MKLLDRAVLFEALTSSFVLALGGIGPVILSGKINSVDIGLWQAAGMNAVFFCTRLLGLYPIRYIFKKWGKQ